MTTKTVPCMRCSAPMLNLGARYCKVCSPLVNPHLHARPARGVVARLRRVIHAARRAWREG